MSFPASLSLHHYFVVAARMQHHFESNLVAVEESGVAALQDPDLAAFELFSGPRGNFMYYWPRVLLAAKTYGSVFYDKLIPSIVRTKW